MTYDIVGVLPVNTTGFCRHDGVISTIADYGLGGRIKHGVVALEARGYHGCAEPVVRGRRLVGCQDHAIALCYVYWKAVDGVRLDKRTICLDDREGMVVNAELELGESTGVNQAKTGPYVLELFR